jgi:hypothetical protein
VDGIDDDAFVVALHDTQLVGISGGFVQTHIDLVERDAAIDVGFACAKEIEIGAMNDSDLGHVEVPSRLKLVTG